MQFLSVSPFIKNSKSEVMVFKLHRRIRDFMTAEFRSNQAEIKNQLNEMQSKLEILTTRVNEVEERVSDIEDKLMATRKTEETRDKQLKDHEDRLREINDSLWKKNLHLIGAPKGAERDTGPEYVFEQILAENIPLFFNFLFIYDSHTERERERGRDTGSGRSRLHAPGARCGIRSPVSRIAPWAKGRRQTAAPPREPLDLF